MTAAPAPDGVEPTPVGPVEPAEEPGIEPGIEPEAESGPDLAALPGVVRTRVVALAAEVLPEVAKPPAAVRRVASFAPARRARLGGAAIADALGDDDFRRAVGTQVAARTAARGEGEDEPAVTAAVRWLTRPAGWTDGLDDLLERAEGSVADERHAREVERLRGRLADAEQALRDQRAAHRAELDDVRAEHHVLRRRLGEARAAEREVRAALEERASADAAVETGVAERAAALEKENRRLRAQLEQLEAQLARGRREARSERDEVTLRTRVLLDTVIDAAAGLRRELGLPVTEGSPADRLEAELAALTDEVVATSSAPASPALLEQLLSMPRARLLVDGYNVSKTAWPQSSLEVQRMRLVTGLAAVVARTRAETTVVFDAAETDHRPPVAAPRGVKVLYSPPGVIADDVLRDLVAAEPGGRVVVAVTGDRALARDLVRSGARAVGPDALLGLMGR
jgi:predicted RNA-binding protein with PIN domain